MNFEEFRIANAFRQRRWHGGGAAEWSVVDWSNASAGEMGEACNAVKKLRRLELKMQQHAGDKPVPETMDAARQAVAKEIGDTVTYLDLLAQHLGLRLEDCVRKAFNQVSEREGFPERL